LPNDKEAFSKRETHREIMEIQTKRKQYRVAQAQGEFCILNPDTVVAEDTFVKVLAAKKKKLG
jgi:hypothetical protein